MKEFEEKYVMKDVILLNYEKRYKLLTMYFIKGDNIKHTFDFTEPYNYNHDNFYPILDMFISENIELNIKRLINDKISYFSIKPKNKLLGSRVKYSFYSIIE